MNGSFLIVIVVILGCLLIKVPVAYGMISGSLIYFLVTGTDAGNVVHLMVNGIFNNYVLLAVPLFVFTANVMNSGEVTEKVFNFANGLCGRFRGGTAYVNILASLIFSGMTGSAIADASGLGIMEIEQMRKEGYEDGFSAAITAATAVIGPIFPPSIPFVVYAMVSGASIGKLFMAGVVPALFVAVVLAIYVSLIAKRRNFPRGIQVARKVFLHQTIRAIPAMLTPVILLVGIYTGVMTPTEAGALAALYSILISVLIYRSLGIKTLWEIIKQTGKTVGQLGLVVCAAYGFSYIVATEHVAQNMANYILGIVSEKNMFLLISGLAFFVMGMFLDTSTMQLIFIPLLLPMVNSLGIDLVHFLPMIALELVVLIVITFVPGTILFMTNVM